MLTIRVGVPLTGGAMVRHVHEKGHPVLFSANAFFSHQPDGTSKLRKHSLPPGLNAALDSAGFVAMARYRGYPWTVETYLDLVESYPWAWYSGMDMCVESEVAGDRRSVRMRLAGTVNGYFEVARRAQQRGLPKPIPILQGRTLGDYLWCAEELGITDGLVGLGSFCRRNVGGEDGIVRLVNDLSRFFPNVRWHLFGVKGKSLDAIGDHPHIESIDSMAWDMEARYQRHTGRTMEYRLGVMEAWLASNLARKRAAPPHQFTHEVQDFSVESRSDPIAPWQRLVADGDMEYASAMAHMDHMWVDGASWLSAKAPCGASVGLIDPAHMRCIYTQRSLDELQASHPGLRLEPAFDNDWMGDLDLPAPELQAEPPSVKQAAPRSEPPAKTLPPVPALRRELALSHD